MGSRKNERTLQMESQYMELWESGMTAREIAKHFNLSFSTVYKSLETIAKKAGKTREELLQRVHKPHVMSSREFKHVEPIDAEALKKNFATVLSGMDDTCNAIELQLRELEEAAEEEVEEAEVAI